MVSVSKENKPALKTAMDVGMVSQAYENESKQTGVVIPGRQKRGAARCIAGMAAALAQRANADATITRRHQTLCSSPLGAQVRENMALGITSAGLNGTEETSFDNQA